MPTLSRLWIKAGILHFMTAMLIGVAIRAGALAPLSLDPVAWTPVFYHLLMVGWITQIIMGVSWWMFPVLGRQRPRGPEWLGWVALFALNGGLILRILGEPVSATAPVMLVSVLLVVSGLLQVVGGGAYVLLIWPRVRTR